MRLAARNLLVLPAVGSALKFQQQPAPKAHNRRQILTLPAAALALPTAARADAGQAWAGPRWAEVDAKLPTLATRRLSASLILACHGHHKNLVFRLRNAFKILPV